ncbi:hypothetical protein QTJ16_000655 [Diplocarpon rosae]|uniref:Uncharacterized protein n=1 Tax=Diplocarpon rosae TaxID=946125 RepID=A0AAD9WFU0_9HELO|nr:hypothetical protein QTJ16_000655 [Diplocarpon rosae]
MATTTSLVPGESKSLSRTPLRPRSVTPTLPNTLRRRSSFILHDSSEEFPSSHESIFEAFCFSGSEGSIHKAELIDIPSRIPRPAKKNDENVKETSPQNFIDATQFRYGNGTVLDTITEQKSFATLRAKARTKSADASPRVPFLTHRDSFILSKTPRRMVSFSLDDIDLIKKSYHDACTIIEKEASQPLLAHEVYAEPKSPIHAPPDRPPTPPGMPSWTAAQRAPIPLPRRQQPAKRSVLQKLLGLPGSPAKASRFPNIAEARDRTVSAPVRGRTAPRFRPPKSVYGAIDQHPFFTAPLAHVGPQVVGPAPEVTPVAKPRGNRLRKQQVRFTPSAIARNSEPNALPNATDSTTAAALDPSQLVERSTPTAPAVQKQACVHRNFSGTSVAASRSEPPRAEYTLLVPDSPSQQSHPEPWSPIGVLPSQTLSVALTQNDRDALCVLDTPRARASISSTRYLMSGALRAPTPPPPGTPDPQPEGDSPTLETKKDWCWKCGVRSVLVRLDRWWLGTEGILCFVCCGFDVDEDGDGNKREGRAHDAKPGDNERVRAARIATPAVFSPDGMGYGMLEG